MVKTIAELIERLKRLDPNTKVISNIYSASDIREAMANYLDSEEEKDRLYKKGDDDVLALFRDSYKGGEDDIYFAACHAAAVVFKDNG